jgi:ubiquinol-cytochrome c reductase core subunit 2
VSAAHRVMAEEVNAYAGAAYTKPNIALVGSGVDKSELSALTADFFKDTPQSSPSGLPGLSQTPSKYFGGEERIAFGKGNTMVIAFPGSSFGGASYKPEADVLAALLGGHAAVKWSSGHSILAKAVSAHAGVSVKTETAKYSDTGLLYVTLRGPSKSLAGAAKDVVTAIKTVASGKVSKDDFKRATAYAKFKLYEAATTPSVDELGLAALNGKVQTAEDSIKGVAGITESTLSQVGRFALQASLTGQAGKKLFEGKASVASVGDLDSLPYAEELGLNV